MGCIDVTRRLDGAIQPRRPHFQVVNALRFDEIFERVSVGPSLGRQVRIATNFTLNVEEALPVLSTEIIALRLAAGTMREGHPPNKQVRLTRVR